MGKRSDLLTLIENAFKPLKSHIGQYLVTTFELISSYDAVNDGDSLKSKMQDRRFLLDSESEFAKLEYGQIQETKYAKESEQAAVQKEIDRGHLVGDHIDQFFRINLGEVEIKNRRKTKEVDVTVRNNSDFIDIEKSDVFVTITPTSSPKVIANGVYSKHMEILGGIIDPVEGWRYLHFPGWHKQISFHCSYSFPYSSLPDSGRKATISCL